MGKVITVWGSPGSGKSMFSCILAKALTRDKRKAIIINAEISVPMLPVWLPEQIIQTNASVGQVLSSVEIDTSLVAGHVTIGQNLENDRDVLKILTSYRRVAGKDFGAELDQTIADMKTGNYENALIHFETRIGSPMLSDVIRGLIGVLRGDDQRMYFKMICFDMRQIEQNNLKKEAAKRPKKIQRYSMMMLICIMIIYLVVLCTEVMGSLGAFFG